MFISSLTSTIWKVFTYYTRNNPQLHRLGNRKKACIIWQILNNQADYVCIVLVPMSSGDILFSNSGKVWGVNFTLLPKHFATYIFLNVSLIGLNYTSAGLSWGPIACQMCPIIVLMNCQMCPIFVLSTCPKCSILSPSHFFGSRFVGALTHSVSVRYDKTGRWYIRLYTSRQLEPRTMSGQWRSRGIVRKKPPQFRNAHKPIQALPNTITLRISRVDIRTCEREKVGRIASANASSGHFHHQLASVNS